MNLPNGWVLPGEFVDYGEPLKTYAHRKDWEEMELVVDLLGQFNIYLDPDDDSQQHNNSTILIGKATGEAQSRSGVRPRPYIERLF
jgi:8-oxo-dGTP diphosphatase